MADAEFEQLKKRMRLLTADIEDPKIAYKYLGKYENMQGDPSSSSTSSVGTEGALATMDVAISLTDFKDDSPFKKVSIKIEVTTVAGSTAHKHYGGKSWVRA